MLAQAEADSVTAAVVDWLARFERALASPHAGELAPLFHPESYLGDVLALTWGIDTFEGRNAILKELPAHAALANPASFQIPPHRTPPHRVTRAGTNAI